MVRIIFIGWGVQNSEIIKVDREATAPLKSRASLIKAKENLQPPLYRHHRCAITIFTERRILIAALPIAGFQFFENG